MKQNDDIEAHMGRLVRLIPPMDETVGELLEAGVRHTAPQELLPVVMRDPGLAADLLFLANTQCFNPGLTEPVCSVEKALTIIGTENLATIVGAAYAQCAIREQFAKPTEWEAYIGHSRAVSLGCKALAAVLGLPLDQHSLLAVAGLTHDIGRVVIIAASTGSEANLLGTPPEQLSSIVENEQAVWGLDHCNIGHRIFEKWKLSEELREGILRHHSPLIKHDYSFYGAMIFMAHFVTMSDFTGETISKMLPAELLRHMSLSAADITEAQRRVGRD